MLFQRLKHNRLPLSSSLMWITMTGITYFTIIAVFSCPVFTSEVKILCWTRVGQLSPLKCAFESRMNSMKIPKLRSFIENTGPNNLISQLFCQTQRARGKLIREVREGFTVDAFIGDATDWERVCMGNLVGMPVIVVPSGFPKVSDPPCNDCRRRATITTGVYAPPHHDHIALALAMAYQSATDHHKQRSPIDDLEPK